MIKLILAPLVAVLAILVLGCSFGNSWGGVKVGPEPTDPTCYDRGDGCRFETQKPDADYQKYGQNPIWNSGDLCNSRCVVKNDKCVQDEIYKNSCNDCLKQCAEKNPEELEKNIACQEKCARK